VSLAGVVAGGPLLLAVPVALAAGAVTFVSPCCLPLVPGYLAYVTSMSADDDREHARPGNKAARGRMVTGAVLFVAGFAVLFAVYGTAYGALGSALAGDRQVITRVLGAVTIVLGLLLAGAFDRLAVAGRIVKPSFRPRAGLAGAPLLGAMFGLGWSPCIGPTLQAVLSLGFTAGTAGRGAFLAFTYSLGLGVPFLITAAAMQHATRMLGLARRHARLMALLGGGLLAALGPAGTDRRLHHADHLASNPLADRLNRATLTELALKTVVACPLHARSSGANRGAAVTRGELGAAVTSSRQVRAAAERSLQAGDHRTLACRLAANEPALRR
jgi:cytochrome c-type biogenesis protein